VTGHALALAAEPDQVLRLETFRASHPGVRVGITDYGHWQAIIPEENGETTTIRYTLAELLDRLAELEAMKAAADPRAATESVP
jgi:hypothetical protein